MIFSPQLAFDFPAVIATFIPIIIFMIPIVALLTKHQQRMAEIIQGQNQNAEVNDLRREVGDLRMLIQHQSLAIEQLRTREIAKGNDAELPLRMRSDQ